MTILVTRPEPGASRTVAALNARGLDAVSCPLFTVVRLDTARPSGKFAALLVTSGHGAEGLTPTSADLPVNLPVFAVGDRTADAMRANGFAQVTSASGDQKALARLVLAKLPPRYRVLLATGEDHKDGLPQAFAAAGHEIALWLRYRADAIGMLPEQVQTSLQARQIEKVLHYSRRASETFVVLCQKAGLGDAASMVQHVALSEDVAEPLRTAGYPNVAIASQPDEEHTLLLVGGDGARQSTQDTMDHPAPLSKPDRAGQRSRRNMAASPVQSSLDATPESSGPETSTPMTVTGSSSESTDAGKIAQPVSDTVAIVLPPDGRAGHDTVAASSAQPAPSSPDIAPMPPPNPSSASGQRAIGWPLMIAVSVLSGIIGAGAMTFVSPWLMRGAVTTPAAVPADITARLLKLEAAPQNAPINQAALQSAVQTALQSASVPVPSQLSEQLAGLDRRLTELAARPQAAQGDADSAVQAAAITELRRQVEQTTAAAEALGPRVADIEKMARSVRTPSASATGAAKLIVADRLSRALAEGRPFSSEIAALTALGASVEPMGILASMAAGGVPALANIQAEFRKLRPVFAAEPASPDAPWSERLLKFTDGLVRVRSTGAVQGSTPAAVASRIDQALQRGDSTAALAAFTDLPEPARRAGEAWSAMLRQRAAADAAIKTITDDAIKALSAPK